MTKPLVALLACACASIAYADPATPPSHPENDFRPIGNGLFVKRDEEAEPGEDGNTSITVFARTVIKATAPYSLDIGALVGMSANSLAVDAGTLGTLHVQMITIDCAHQTYQVIDAHKALPEPIWRPAATLPALAPVFRFGCHRQRTGS